MTRVRNETSLPRWAPAKLALLLIMFVAEGCAQDNVVNLGEHDSGTAIDGKQPSDLPVDNADAGEPVPDQIIVDQGQTDMPDDATSPHPDAGKNVGLHDKCATPVPLTLVNGKALVVDSIDCDSFGSQQGCKRFYSLAMDPSKHYRIRLEPTFSVELCVFIETVGCDDSDIASACASGGETGDGEDWIYGDTSRTLTFAPKVAGEHRILVDGSVQKSGTFTLAVEETPPQQNGTCQTATTLAFGAGGTATASGSTDTLPDEFAGLSCDGIFKMGGHQAYYRFTAAAGKGYQITVSPEFDAHVFTAAADTCTETALAASCASGGTSGRDLGSVSPDDTLTAFFMPATPGSYLIVIDALAGLTDQRGSYSLTLTELTPPPNSVCVAADTLAFGGSKATAGGNTGLASNELTDLTCGGGWYAAYDGPQVYFSADLQAKVPYRFTLSPQYKATMYLFRAAVGCSASAINADCGSGGEHGLSAGPVMPGETDPSYFVPATTETFKLAVDSLESNDRGAFSVTIDQLVPLTANATCATALPLAFVGTLAKASGHTAGVDNEFGDAIDCDSGYTFSGPQVYYRLSLLANVEYRIVVSTDYLGAFYVFPANVGCDAAAVNQGCKNRSKLALGAGTEVLFNPPVGGDYIIAIDSDMARTMGSFELEVHAP